MNPLSHSGVCVFRVGVAADCLISGSCVQLPSAYLTPCLSSRVCQIVVWNPGVVSCALSCLFVPRSGLSCRCFLFLFFVGLSRWIALTDSRTHGTFSPHHWIPAAHRSPCVTTLLLSSRFADQLCV
ncbi:hypothetical protein DPX16_1880 [Anabarilius grahami]|uniref:Uncharacterized protein n=1 Tax=Anabarilius grahami TaxID=495550 RepID=A0A3N0YSF3_ANAGA|nr:hypothetical protein DPX16_1880 [Anabarilius grahami]